MTFDYIASPYSHKDPNVRTQRYLEAMKYTAFLMQARIHCFSPIVHCHTMAELYSLPKTFEFWKDYDETMLSHANCMRLLMLPGWEDSIGIAEEMKICKESKKTILLISPIEYGTSVLQV